MDTNAQDVRREMQHWAVDAIVWFAALAHARVSENAQKGTRAEDELKRIGVEVNIVPASGPIMRQSDATSADSNCRAEVYADPPKRSAPDASGSHA